MRISPSTVTPMLGLAAVIILSGCSKTPAYEERAAALQVDGFLTKPVPLDQLLEQVRKTLAAYEQR